VLGLQKGAQELSAQARAIEWNPLATLRCSSGMVLRVALLLGGKKSPPPTTSITRGHTMAVVEASGPSQDRPTRPVLMLSIPAVRPGTRPQPVAQAADRETRGGEHQRSCLP
jgi:hypothetical protein